MDGHEVCSRGFPDNPRFLQLILAPVCVILFPVQIKSNLSFLREIFLRELLSNANDALEKLRLTALTDKRVWDGSEPLNVTIKAIKDEDGPGGRIVITGKYRCLTQSNKCYENLYRHWHWNEPRRTYGQLGMPGYWTTHSSRTNAFNRVHWQSLAPQNFSRRLKAPTIRELET